MTTSRGSLPLGKMGVRLQVHPTSVTNLVDGLEKRVEKHEKSQSKKGSGGFGAS